MDKQSEFLLFIPTNLLWENQSELITIWSFSKQRSHEFFP